MVKGDMQHDTGGTPNAPLGTDGRTQKDDTLIVDDPDTTGQQPIGDSPTSECLRDQRAAS
ncbi:MAG: hypothetical protein DCC65_00260 [Planctomycetota bacterium]|nr:MAG: hypothetical protein DCC65_00260 [Planctomycetota bacterium]